jgi:hypothetical protein
LVETQQDKFLDVNSAGDIQVIGLQSEEDRRHAELIMQLLDTERMIDVHRAETRFIPLNRYADSGKQWQLVVDTEIENSRRVVTLKSLVNFVNHLDIPIEIYSTNDLSTMNKCGVAQPDKKPLNVPLDMLYTATGDFFFQPTSDA